MTIALMDEEIGTRPRYHRDRNKFVLRAIEYVLYCLQFGEGLGWIVEDEAAVEVAGSQRN
jgi:hypothetical protein